MTLSTDLYIHDPVVIPDLLAEARRNLALYDEDGRPPERHIPLDTTRPWNEGYKTVGNEIGQGLPSMLLIHYGGDGPLRPDATEHDPDICDLPGCSWWVEGESEECDGSGHDPAMFASVNWDTTYGYDNPQVGGCADLHARLIVHLGHWLDARGIDWSWRNEFTGEVHHRYDGLDAFVGSGQEARAWFTGTVLPAIEAHAAAN
jgi:hypothetical protein